MLLVPVEVAVNSRPSLTVVMTVTNSCSEVTTRSLVLTTAEVREVAGARVVEAGALALVGADEAGLLFPPSVLEAAGGGEVAGAFEVASVVGSAAVVGWAEVAGALVEAGGRDVTWAADVGDAPVPAACRFWPWCRYASIPSMRRSSRAKADVRAATRARTARNSQSLENMMWAVWRY